MQQRSQKPTHKYVAAGGRNGVFNFPSDGTHRSNYWGQQLQMTGPAADREFGRRRSRPTQDIIEAHIAWRKCDRAERC